MKARREASSQAIPVVPGLQTYYAAVPVQSPLANTGFRQCLLGMVTKPNHYIITEFGQKVMKIYGSFAWHRSFPN